MKYTKEELDERVDKATQLFEAGFNCSQSVAAAFADLHGLDEAMALRVSASFGGGIGRMRETCGAACALFILAGLDTSAINAEDQNAKTANYRLVHDLADQFVAQNGSLCCAELLGLKPMVQKDSESNELSNVKLEKRTCAEIVKSAARIWADYLLNKEES